MMDLIDRAVYRETLRMKSAELGVMLRSCNRRALEYMPKQMGLQMAIVALDQVIAELDSAPAVDTEPVINAEWILHPEIGPGEADKECSACGTMSLISSVRCHRCGAHMRVSYGPGQAVEQEAPANEV